MPPVVVVAMGQQLASQHPHASAHQTRHQRRGSIPGGLLLVGLLTICSRDGLWLRWRRRPAVGLWRRNHPGGDGRRGAREGAGGWWRGTGRLLWWHTVCHLAARRGRLQWRRAGRSSCGLLRVHGWIGCWAGLRLLGSGALGIQVGGHRRRRWTVHGACRRRRSGSGGGRGHGGGGWLFSIILWIEESEVREPRAAQRGEPRLFAAAQHARCQLVARCRPGTVVNKRSVALVLLR